MSERVTALLKSAGLTDPALHSLERGNAIFVLTRQTLLYQDDGGIRRVTLRDLTRVHSDQEGLLRVETPAGTALTASLVGFDPVDVQKFFREVQAATARAKEAVQEGGWAAGRAPTPKPSAAAPPPASMSSAQTLPPRPQAAWSGGGAGPANPLTSPPPAAKLPPRPVPSMGQFEAPPVEESVTVIRADGQRERTVTQAAAPSPSATPPSSPTVIPSPVKNHRDAPPPRDPKPEVKPVATPPVAAPTKAAPAPAPKPAETPATPEVVVEEQPERVVPLPSLGTLATNSSAWVGRLRFLGVFLLLAALALAYLLMFQYDQSLNGIWVLIAGGMSAIALVALADLVKLLVGIARALERRGVDER